jgi:type IV pilus assembly protein PilM
MPSEKIGLDIADNSIEVIKINKKQKDFAVTKFNRIVLKSGIVQRGRIKNEVKLKEALQKLFKEAKPNPIKDQEIIFALPESQVYTYIFTLDSHNKKDRESLIQENIKETIPLYFKDIFFTYQILKESKKGVEILLIAASIKVILEWQRFFKKFNFKVDFFDVETLALFKGLNLEKELPVCIVDIGSASSNISIFDKNKLRYINSLVLAGNHWTDKLSQGLEISLEEAEKKKKILKILGKTKGAKILNNEIDILSREIKKILEFYQSKSKKEVKNIVLLGGSSQLKGLVEYLINFFKKDKIKVELGQSNLKKLSPIEYIGAIGSAMKGMDKKSQRNSLYFDLAEVKKVYKERQVEILKKKKIKKKKSIKENKSLESSVSNSSSKSKVIILIIILALGIFLIAGAFWYKNEQDQKKKELQEKMQAELLEIPEVSIIDEEIKVKDLETATSTEEEIVEELKYIVIDDNSSGWLNVRKGSGTNYEILTKVYPKEEYIIIKEESGWYKIEISEEESGWVSADYVSLKE